VDEEEEIDIQHLEKIFGNDGHLLFKEVEHTYPVTKIDLHWAEDLAKKHAGSLPLPLPLPLFPLPL